ncbi:MAG TPA: ABC transporter substrate-binding protein [Vicinamibacterales bacterium]|nr:ABC transporter substrate-binding protein [Vicinamibacterales bacterium]
MSPTILKISALLMLLVLFVAEPSGTGAQTARRAYRIGVLHPAFVRVIPSVQGLKDGLQAAGLEEGRDVSFDVRFTRGKSEAADREAAEIVATRPDVIFTVAEELAVAARKATSTIPIVFVDVGDPVAAGIVASVSRPGRNITGVSSLLADLVPKRLEVLKSLLPTARRVWLVYHADDRSSSAVARITAGMGPRFKLDVVDRAVHTHEELATHLRGLKAGDVLLAPMTTTLNIPGIILDLQLMNRVPAIFPNAFWVDGGGLASYGADMTGEGRQAARLVEKILRGARPEDLPVEGANKIELAINLKAARSLNITVPNELLLRAEHVVE